MKADIQPATGRTQLDRDYTALIRENEITSLTYQDLAEEAKVGRLDINEGMARAAMLNPDFRALVIACAKDIKNENKKYPAELAIEEAVKTLSVEEGYQYFDKHLKRLMPKEEIVAGLETMQPLTLETLQAKEDEIIEDLRLQELNEADQRATFFKGSVLTGVIKVSRNEVRYAEEVKVLSKKSDRQERERAHHRENRTRILATAVMLLQAQLRQPGTPQGQKLYHEQEWREATDTKTRRRIGSSTTMSQSAYETEGGATKKDRTELERALRKPAPS